MGGINYKKIDVMDPDFTMLVTSTDVAMENNKIMLHGDDFPLFDRESVVKIIGYLNDGVTAMEGVVTLSIDKQLNIDVTKKSETKDRRSYLKVRTDASATVRKVCFGEKSGRIMHLDEKVKLRDISVGGICFFSDRVFLAKQRIYLDLHEIKEGLNVQAQVLRKQRENRRYAYRYRYGCRFIGLSNLNQRIICEYVFKKELENYRKEQEKDSKIYD